MKFTPTHFLIPGLFALILSSCVSTQYAPSPINTPLFEAAEEFTANAQVSSYGTSHSIDFQGAYAVTDNWAMMFNTSRFHAQNKDSSFFFDEDFGLEGRNYDFGVGYFKAFGSGGVYEVYGGMNILKGQNRYFNQSSSQFSARGFFLQPTIGWNVGDIFVVSLGLRFLYTDYHTVNFDPGNTSGYSYNSYNILRKPTEALFMEPHLTMRVGYRYLKFQMQLRGVTDLIYSDLAYMPIAISFGVVVDFKPRFSKAKSEPNRDSYRFD